MFPEVRCIHLVTVSDEVTNTTVLTSAVPARAKRINDAIARLAANDPRITVIDWNARVHEYEQQHPGESATLDTTHPNDAGTAMLVDDYEAALDACPD